MSKVLSGLKIRDDSRICRVKMAVCLGSSTVFPPVAWPSAMRALKQNDTLLPQERLMSDIRMLLRLLQAHQIQS